MDPRKFLFMRMDKTWTDGGLPYTSVIGRTPQFSSGYVHAGCQEAHLLLLFILYRCFFPLRKWKAIETCYIL